MKKVRILVVLGAVLALAVAVVPQTEAGRGSGGDDVAFMSYSPGGGLIDADFFFTGQVTCNITCANGKRTSEEVDDEQGCIDACNDFCNTDRCRILAE